MTNSVGVALLACLVLASTAPPAPRPAEASADPVARGWSARAELAKKRLAGPGLDACDRALERAFAGPRVKQDGAKRRFMLKIEVEGERFPMAAVYGYVGAKLEDFVVYALPPGWLLRQPVGSRTLSVLLSEANCAFDLCPADPLASAPCP